VIEILEEAEWGASEASSRVRACLDRRLVRSATRKTVALARSQKVFKQADTYDTCMTHVFATAFAGI
jgi:hypothetical protein